MNKFYENLSQDEKNDYLVGHLLAAIGRGDFRNQVAMLVDYVQREAYFRGVEQGRKEAEVQQEPKKPRRRLVEILAEEWTFWPDVQAVEQTCLGHVMCTARGRNLIFGEVEVASDQDTAVVTESKWLEAKFSKK